MSLMTFMKSLIPEKAASAAVASRATPVIVIATEGNAKAAKNNGKQLEVMDPIAKPILTNAFANFLSKRKNTNTTAAEQLTPAQKKHMNMLEKRRTVKAGSGPDTQTGMAAVLFLYKKLRYYQNSKTTYVRDRSGGRQEVSNLTLTITPPSKMLLEAIPEESPRWVPQMKKASVRGLQSGTTSNQATKTAFSFDFSQVPSAAQAVKSYYHPAPL